MKISLIILGIFAIALAPLRIEAVMLEAAWNPNTESDLAGYNVYKQDGTKINTDLIPISTSPIFIFDVTEPFEGDYCVWVTAVDQSGNESGPSNIACTLVDTIAPAPPIGCTLTKQ